jgi:hypothetical protein
MATTSPQQAARSAEHNAERAAHSDTVEKLARFGYAVKGVVYGLIGVLAVMAALGEGGQTSGSRGVLSTIAGGPFGQVLLVLVPRASSSAPATSSAG